MTRLTGDIRAAILLTLVLGLPTIALADERSEEELRKDVERLEDRVGELEASKTATEDATRSIIRQSLSTLGSRINEAVVFGGTIEVVAGRVEPFRGRSENVLELGTAELDFEIEVFDWARAGLVIQYDTGNVDFVTADNSEKKVDRMNVDTAVLTIGDTERFWGYSQLGRMVVPLGISTGDPVADVLTIEDPLTVETFEMKEDAILIGFAFPTRPLAPLTPIPSPPPVRPQVLNPLARWLARAVGYNPPPPPPPAPSFMTPAPRPAPFNIGVYSYNGDTQKNVNNEGWRPTKHIGATAGVRTDGALPYFSTIPWSVDADVDFARSIFDTSFLGFEHREFLTHIGFVPGMGASLKLNIGPTSLVGEWNGAIEKARFFDETGRRIGIRPSAWQISAAYQFDWNSSVQAIGAQGSYIAVGYSRSYDLEGVIDSSDSRVGNVPQKRILVGVGEWVMDGLRIALEYSYQTDYLRSRGGTGKTANAIVSQFTYEW